jgi:hypothetical protein
MAMCVLFCVERAETSRSRFILADCWQQHSCSSLCRVTFRCMLSLVNSTHYNHVYTHHDSARCHRFKHKQEKWFQTESSTFPIAWSIVLRIQMIQVYNFFFRKLRSWHFLLFFRFYITAKNGEIYWSTLYFDRSIFNYLLCSLTAWHNFWSKT